MRMGYSGKANAFYFLNDEGTYKEAGTWQDDIIPITEEVWLEYAREPPAGKQRAPDEKGYPKWTDFHISEEELKKICAFEKEALLERAETEIRRLSIVSDVYELKESEKTKLNAWKKHLADVYRLEPDNKNSVQWPLPPDMDI